jgi:hypothetical protein
MDHAFLTLESVRDESSAARFYRFTPQGQKQHCSHWIGGRVGSKTDTDEVETKKKIPEADSAFRPSSVHPTD